MTNTKSSKPTIISLTEEKIQLDDLLQELTLPTCGASVIFTGLVREITFINGENITSALEYDAYRGMAEEKMMQIVIEIRNKWPEIEGIAIIQRLGHLEPGTPTTVVGCTAAHRNTGVFDAARYGIERIKEIVPVWKKEIGPNGQSWVMGHYHPRPDE